MTELVSQIIMQDELLLKSFVGVRRKGEVSRNEKKVS